MLLVTNVTIDKTPIASWLKGTGVRRLFRASIEET
jgi:hypothetical protein